MQNEREVVNEAIVRVRRESPNATANEIIRLVAQKLGWPVHQVEKHITIPAR